MPIRRNTIVSGTDDFIKSRKRRAKQAMTAILIEGIGEALLYTPLHTGALRNSAYRDVKETSTSIVGKAGFIQSYALPLNSPLPGSKMDGWKPRPVGQRGKKSGGANLRAKQGFLNLGFENTTQIRQAIIKRYMGV